MPLSYDRVFKVLPKIYTILTFYGHANQNNISSTQHKLQYNTGVVQDNAAQKWWYSTIPAAKSIANTGKCVKMVHPEFFGEDGSRSSHHSDLKTNDCR